MRRSSTPQPGLANLGGLGVVGSSVTQIRNLAIGLRHGPTAWDLVVWVPTEQADRLDGLDGSHSERGGGTLLIGPDSESNAAWLRREVPWLRPSVVGSTPSVGFGDRLGIATPGHVRAMAGASELTPVFAQQSPRELDRTKRTFANVMTAATFGVLASGWRSGWGADADHLKTGDQLDAAVSAGFTTFTVDPSDHVQDVSFDAPHSVIEAALDRVPWTALGDDRDQLVRRYPDSVEIEGTSVALGAERIAIAAARFGGAVAHVAAMHTRLRAATASTAVELEVAVDELPFPTTAVDHVYLASEFHRLGISWVGLAPGFVGVFEKGVDYIGDPERFAGDVALHAALARHFGPYKLSLHSGSEKFSILHSFSRATYPFLHLKTSGTSYLEALRAVGMANPELLRRIWATTLASYATSRTDYHVSAPSEGLPEPGQMTAAQLVGLLDHDASRQALHVSFGAVLADAPATIGVAQGLGDEVRSFLWANRDEYWSLVASHLARHVSYLRGEP